MRKKSKILVVILFFVFLTGCKSNVNLEITEKIKAPKNITPPLEGKWVIESYKENKHSSLTKSAAETYIDKEILIDNKLVVVSANYTVDPSFKSKTVKAADYLIYQYRLSGPDFLDIKEDDINVITVTGPDQFYYEFIVLNENKAYVNIDGTFFLIEKTRDYVDKEIVAEYYYKSQSKGAFRMSDKDDTDKKTGVLIGLKSKDEDSKIDRFDYRTIYLRFDDRKIKGAYEKKDLFVPRKKGFWKVGVSEDYDAEGNIIAESIYSRPIKKGMDLNRSVALASVKNPNILKEILYVGSEYISIENKISGNNSVEFLEFFSLDSVESSKPLKLTDVIGKDGPKVFSDNMYKDDIIRANKDIIDDQTEIVNENNFGIFRRNGHWILKGRLNFMKNAKNVHRDFNIKMVIPEDIIGYDRLNIPWSVIKMKLPEAKDAFLSPDENIILIQTNNHLMVYSLDGNNIGDVPILKIEVDGNTSIVMKEWAQGKYSNNWEEEFLKSDFKSIEYK